MRSSFDSITANLIINDYQIIEEIGRGSFGHVYKVKHIKGDNQIYAMKILLKSKFQKKKKKMQFINEVKTMKSISSDYCVKCFKNFSTQNYLCIVLEYCNSGNLIHFVANHKPNE